DIPVKNVVVVEAPQRRAEVEAAAQHIFCLCREHNYRFRNIAVILRDFTDYQELIEAVFSDYGIAYFIDRRRSVHHHPLIELLRSGLAALVSDFKTEHVIDYLKTDLVPLPREAVDELENYCLAHGIQSAQWRAERPWQGGRVDKKRASDTTNNLTVAQIDSYRRKAVAVLLEIRANLYGEQFQPEKKLSVREITGRIVYLLEKLKVAESLSRWYRDEQDYGRLDQAQTHEQIYSDVIDRLDDVVAALGENEITLQEYAEILDGAWEQMTLRLIPPVLDQVLVGTIERSRHPQIQAAFVLGLNERNFPQVIPPDAFFTDPQRELLQEGGFELGPASGEKLLHERYLAYIALTRARKFLWAGYIVADDKANVLNPSSFIDNIFNAVDDAVFVRLGEDLGQANIDKISTVGQLAGQLARAFSDSRQDYRSVDPIWEQLYHYARSREDWAGSLRRGLAGLTYRNLAVLDSVTVEKLFSANLAGSVSRLETFAACPFQFFARYVLRIEPRAELKLAAPDMGSFYHEALYQIFLLMRRAELDWSDLSDVKIEDFIAEAVSKLTEVGRDFAELREQSSRNRFLLSLAAERLGGFCRSLRATAAAGDFHQRYGELGFGDGGAIPALEIAMAGGRRLVLRGKIDRIDMSARPDGRVGLSVIDYKTSARPFSFVRFYHGLSLQLISYLLVLQNHYSLLDGTKTGSIEPAAALYLPIHRQGDSHKEPPPEDVLDGHIASTEKLHKAAGIMNHQWLSVLDHTVNFGQGSSYYSFAVNKDGSVRNAGKSGVIEPDEMRRMLTHGRNKLAQMAAEILDGKIDVAPYRLGEKETPCSHCDYRTFCRFDFSSDPYRQLSKYNKLEVLERIKDNS
ncbi:MAG: exodeoxyribonuclease V subunit gamma, partial [Sedimentisphaerales bacterium]|nr:exodeoxyribonuclease V subunit gamma [Sedimentisphaerales bacterium]